MLDTFTLFEQRAAAFHRIHNTPPTPAALACRAIEQLRDALAGCDPIERAEILTLLADEVCLAEIEPAA